MYAIDLGVTSRRRNSEATDDFLVVCATLRLLASEGVGSVFSSTEVGEVKMCLNA
jgi:hypothetical protein